MKINSKIRYGLRTIMEIASCPEPNGVLQKDISVHQTISLKYLDSIISSLKLKGLVINTRGKGSGYKLARPAEQITMWDIYTAFEPLTVVDCIVNRAVCGRTFNCKAKTYWCEFKQDFKDILVKKTLLQIIQEEVKQVEVNNLEVKNNNND